MAKGKPPAWALELAARVATGASTSTSPRKPTANKSAKAAKKVSAKRTRARVGPPGQLARVLASASSLPRTDPVWVACEARLSGLVDTVGNDTSALAEVLGVDRRSAQRLRAAYGIERRLVNGEWR